MITNQNNFVYRKGSENDKTQLKHIGLISFGQYFNQLTPEHVVKLTHSLNDEDKLNELIRVSTIFVCCDGDKIIGTAYFIPHGNPWDIFKTEWSYIRMVGVDPAYQGKGIGRKLTELCINEAKKNNEKTIALHTSEIMLAARHIYENLGFKMVQAMEPRLGLKYWLYRLEL